MNAVARHAPQSFRLVLILVAAAFLGPDRVGRDTTYLTGPLGGGRHVDYDGAKMESVDKDCDDQVLRMPHPNKKSNR